MVVAIWSVCGAVILVAAAMLLWIVAHGGDADLLIRGLPIVAIPYLCFAICAWVWRQRPRALGLLVVWVALAAIIGTLARFFDMKTALARLAAPPMMLRGSFPASFIAVPVEYGISIMAVAAALQILPRKPR